MPDWLLPTFLLLPALLWMFWGVGIPWALALLPSADWSRQIEVLTLVATGDQPSAPHPKAKRCSNRSLGSTAR